MSAEYPPIIIDGSNLVDNPDPAAESFGLVAASPAVATEKVTIKPTLVSLYLIYDNQLIHQGDYKTEQIRLVWGTNPGQAMAVGGTSMTLDASSLRESGTGSTRVVQRGAKQVKEIHVPTQQEPLMLGRDFHNFLIIVQQRG